MRNYRSGVAMALMVLAGCSALSGGSSDPAPTAPVPTTAAPFTAAPPTSTTDSTTTPATTASPTVAPPTTSLSTTTKPPVTTPATTAPATTVPTGPVAVGGEPFLVDIPGKMIDYVPDVAANLNIDVPGQYYELLDRVYVFIPTQASRTNSNLQPPAPADRPILESYSRAMASVMKVYTSDPTPADGSPEMKQEFTEAGFEVYRPLIAGQAADGYHTEVRAGYIVVPRVVVGTLTEREATVLDCGWLDQQDVNSDGTIREEWDEENPAIANLVRLNDRWQVDRLVAEAQGCA